MMNLDTAEVFHSFLTPFEFTCCSVISKLVESALNSVFSQTELYLSHGQTTTTLKDRLVWVFSVNKQMLLKTTDHLSRLGMRSSDALKR